LFAPVRDEHALGEGVLAKVVSGRIPEDLVGVFLRQGPNPWAPMTKRYMVFDGDGMLHTMRFKAGEARYHNAYMNTPRLLYEKERGSAYFPRIGELHKTVGILKAILVLSTKAGLAGFNDDLAIGQANTAMGIVPNGRLWALHEGSYPFEVHLDWEGGITSVGHDSLDGKLEFAMSAHPKMDTRTGEAFFHGYSPIGGRDGKTFLAFGRIDAAGKLQSSITLKTTMPSFNHDMALTESYALVFDSPVKFDAMNIATGGSAFAYKEGHALRLAVIPRKATSESEVKYFDLPAVAFVHSLHAWEEEGGQVLVFWLPLGYAGDFKGILEGCCQYWHMSELRLDLRNGEISVKNIDPEADHHGEFPNIRSDLVGGSARYGYTALLNKTLGASQFDFIGVTKWDMQEKRVASEIVAPEGHLVGESVLMPRAGGSGDPSDDGYIGTFLYPKDGDGNSTDFVIYDARTMASEPVARLRLPVRVPLGFHAQWMTEKELEKHLAHAAKSR